MRASSLDSAPWLLAASLVHASATDRTHARPRRNDRLDRRILVDSASRPCGRARRGAPRRRLRAPVRGAATFDVVVDRSGGAEVHLDEADSEASSWAGLARAMAEAVKKKVVRIPSGARALRVVVRLDAKVQYADGRDTKDLGAFVHPTGLVVADDSMVVKSVPGVNVGAAGKVCSGGIHVGLDGVAIMGGCDPTNIGTVPVRVVHGREMGEVAL